MATSTLAAYGGVGLRDLERRRLPGEYDLDLDLDLERERLLEDRDRLRLLWGQQDNGARAGAVHSGFLRSPHAYLDLEREEERDRDREREREEEREDLEDRELERDEERPRLLDRLRDLEGPLQGNGTVRSTISATICHNASPMKPAELTCSSSPGLCAAVLASWLERTHRGHSAPSPHCMTWSPGEAQVRPHVEEGARKGFPCTRKLTNQEAAGALMGVQPSPQIPGDLISMPIAAVSVCHGRLGRGWMEPGHQCSVQRQPSSSARQT